MRVTMDRAGRIVIPKPLRDSLGLQPDTELDLYLDGSGLRIELADWEGRQVQLGADGLPILVPVPGGEFTNEDIKRLRDELQR